MKTHCNCKTVAFVKKMNYLATMSKLQKVIGKLLDLNQVFTFKDLLYLLSKLNYVEKKTGKTSGSRKAYVNQETGHIIRIHKPHPGNELKRYIRTYLIQELKNQELI